MIDGFPVSIGIASSDGRMFYAMIKPHPEWDMGYRWDPNAEAIHGFTREHLVAHGREAAVVVAEIKSMFGDAAFTSDSPGHDNAWFQELISVSGIEYKPLMHRATTRMWLETLFDELDISSKARRAIIEMREEMRTHNALSDAASSIAADAAARAWPTNKDLRDCRNVIESWKKRVKVVVIGLGVIEKYSDALNELSKR
ncbi:MAG: hypothetical protein ING69_10735 [Rhodocyclaceae bacterium]|nr:hypothetical protein [Rhodocyclaceae bacterium]